MSYELILSRDSFLLASELRFFWAVALAYGVSLLLHIFHMLTRGALAGKAAHAFLWAAGVAHAGLTVFRAFEAGRAPFQTPYEGLSWFACSAALTWLFVSRKWKGVYLPGTLTAALAFGASLFALFSYSPAIEPVPAHIRWSGWRVAPEFFSYAVFAVSAAIEMSWLAMRPIGPSGRATGYGFSPGMMEDFHDTAGKLALFAFPLLTFGILTGAALANGALGRYWSWAPWETWPLATWIVFAAYLHSRTTPSMRGAPASAFSIIGFICALMTVLGVEWLARLLGMPGMHIHAV